MTNFYLKFQIFSRFPLWRNYLRKVYRLAKEDGVELTSKKIADRAPFAALLCGVASEITADEFIQAVFLADPTAHIQIIDLGKEQVASVKKLVADKYVTANIAVRQANALDLSFLHNKSFDWIDTDGFFGFFDHDQLIDLLKEWKRLVKDDGFITFRELIPKNAVGEMADKFRATVAHLYMGIDFQRHSFSELKEDFDLLGLSYRYDSGVLPFFSRFCLAKKVKN